MHRGNHPEREPRVMVMCNNCTETGWIEIRTLLITGRQPVVECQRCGDGRMAPIPGREQTKIEIVEDMYRINLN